ncbi:MAG: hypothetical protein ACK4K1_04920 [Flavobacterium sp.]|jgi:hypothetical protein
MLQGILFSGIGIFFVLLSYRDEKTRKIELSTSYVMHLKGYIGGIVLIIIGLIYLSKEIFY